jgi:hypothetical protein
MELRVLPLHVTQSGCLRGTENAMNREEMIWLLQTIKDPRKAKRFVLAQYERGRISFQVMADVSPDQYWIDCRASRSLVTPTDQAPEYSTTEFPIAFAW